MAAISWKSAISADWSVTGDWNPATIPGSPSAVTIAAAGASPYTVSVSLAESTNTLTLNAATASLQVNNTLTMAGALTLTNGTLDLVGEIKGGKLLLNGGTLAPGGGTLAGVEVQGALLLTQSFGSPLVVAGGMKLSNLAGTGAGQINLTGAGASLVFAPGVQTLTSAVAGQSSVVAIGSTSGDTISEQNAGGTITTATIAAKVTTDQVGQFATLTVSGQAGDSMVNQGFIDAAVAGGIFTINGGSFVNQGTITANLGDTVTIASSSFTNSGTINVLNTATLNIGPGPWTSTGKIAAVDATVNLLGTVTAAEIHAITSRAGGLVDLVGTLNLGGGTLAIGTGTTIGAMLLTGEIANGIVHDAGLGLQFGANSSPPATLSGVTYQGVLDLSEASAQLAVLGAFTVTGTGGTGAGVINLTGASSNLTLTGSRTLDNATLRLGAAGSGISIANPGTTTAVTFGPHLTIDEAGALPNQFAVLASIAGSSNPTDSLLNQGGIFGSVQNGALTIQAFGTFTNAGAIGFSNGNDLMIDAGTVTNQNSITLGNGVIAQFDGATAFNNPGVLSAGVGDSITIEATTLSNAGTMSIGLGSTLGITGFSGFVNQGAISLAAGATLTIGSSLAAWTSTGTITSNNATVALDGIVTQAQIGAIKRVGGGVIDIAGTLSETAAPTTLNVGTGSAFGALQLTGTIVQGTIHDAGGGLTFVGSQNNLPMLNGVIYEGAIDLSEANAQVEVVNGIALTGKAGTGAGTINLTGVGAELLFAGTTVLDNATVNLGAVLSFSFQPGAILGAAGAPALLTLGAHLVVQQVGQVGTIAGPTIAGNLVTSATDMLINRGTINAVLNGGSLTISGNQFDNFGVITVSNDDFLDITANSFTNAGTVNVLTGGTIGLGSGGDWTSSGKFVETAATVLLQGDITLPEINDITRSGGMLVIAGRFNNQGGTLGVGTGSALGDFLLAGTIDSGIINDAGGGLVFQNGTLDAVAYQGVVNLSAAGADLTVLGGLTATDVTGTKPGLINLTGAGSTLALQEPQTLDNTTIDIGSVQGDTLMVTAPFFNTGPWTTTLGSKLDIVQTGTAANLSGSTASADMLQNNGTIAAGFTGGTLAINGRNFTNAGSLGVSNGDTLNMAATAFSNTGTLSVTTNGVLNLGFGGNAVWSSTGVLKETNGTINLDGPVTLANLNSITRSGGVITLNSTANLGGGSLNVGGGSALGALVDDGTIQNGIIHDAGSGLSFTNGVLTNITDRGTLSLSGAQSALTISGSIAFTGLAGTGAGTILLTGQNAALTTLGTEELNNANLSLGGAELKANPSTGVLTLGPSLSITHTLSSNGTNGLAEITSFTLINQGVISAGLAGGSLLISGNSFANQGIIRVSPGDLVTVSSTTSSNSGVMTVNAASMTIGAASAVGAGTSNFTNTGTVLVVGGGTLDLGPVGAASGFTWTGPVSETNASIIMNGPVTLANLNSITRSAGTVALAGVANLAGGTLAVGAGSALGALVLTGTIENGTIHDPDAGVLGRNGTLDLTNYQGTMDLTSAGSELTVQGSLGLTGLSGTGLASILLANGSQLVIDGTESLANAALRGNSGASLLSAAVGTAAKLTLAGSVSVVNSSGSFTIAGGDPSGSAAAALTLQGSITADAPGGLFTISGGVGGSILNQGPISVSNGDTMSFQASTFTNSRSVSITTRGVVNIGTPGSPAGLIGLGAWASVILPGAVFPAGGSSPGTWSGAGTVGVNAGSLNIYDSVAPAQMTRVTSAGGQIALYGLFNLGAATWNTGNGTPIGQLKVIGGEIANGTIHDAGGGLQFFAAISAGASVPATLDNVTDETAALSQSQAFSSLAIAGTFKLTGANGTGAGLWNLTGVGAAAYAVGSITLNSLTINIGNAQPAGSLLAAVDPTGAGGDVFTLGAGVTINVVAANAAIDDAPGLGDVTVNEGRIVDTLTGSVMSIDGGSFTNAGTVTVGAGATVNADTNGAFVNQLALNMLGGTFNTIAVSNAATGSVFGHGTFNGQVTGSGTVEANGGLLSIGQGIAGNMLKIDAGATLQVGGALTAGSATFEGTTGDLALAMPASATSTPILHFAASDVIDLKGVTVTAMTFVSTITSGGVLTVTNGSTTVVKLEFTGSYTTANFKHASDGSGGTDIGFVPTTGGITVPASTDPLDLPYAWISDFLSASQGSANGFVNVGPTGHAAGGASAVPAWLDTNLAELMAHHAVGYN